MMIYFCGHLDWRSTQTQPPHNINPVVIRGYDEAGNLLCAIRYGQEPLIYGEVVIGGDTYRHVHAITEAGVAVVAYTQFHYPTPFPKAMAVDSSGHIYTLLVPIDETIHGSYPVYVGGTRVYGIYIDKVRKHRRDGTRIPFPACPHNARIHCVAVDDDDNVYFGGDQDASPTPYVLHKYNSAGVLQWSAPASINPGSEYLDAVFAIAVDSAGNVYTAGGKIFGGGLIRKYNSAGVLQWTQRPAGQQFSICLDGAGNVYTSGNFSTGHWLTDAYFQAWGTIPGYIGGGAPSAADFYWYPSGVFPESFDDAEFYSITQWAASDGDYIAGTEGSTFQRIAFDGVRIVAYHNRNSASDFTIKNFKKYDTDLAIIYEEDVGAGGGGFRKIFCDGNQHTYFIANRKATFESIASPPIYRDVVWHFNGRDSANAELWTGMNATQAPGVRTTTGVLWSLESESLAALYATLEYTTAYGNLAGPDLPSLSRDWFVEDGCAKLSQTPPLKIHLDFGVATWQGDRYVQILTGVPIPLAARAPVWLLEPARAGVLQLTYRVSVLGDPRLYLPLRSFSARWTEDGLALSVVCPGLTLAQVETLAARVGEPLVLDSAYRLGGDPVTSQWIEFLRVDFETIRGSFGGRSAASILEGNAEYVADGGRTRIARGVSFRTGGAQRRVRCAPDTYLRPGDVLQDGAETWTAGDITLAVSATNATMEVLERGA